MKRCDVLSDFGRERCCNPAAYQAMIGWHDDNLPNYFCIECYKRLPYGSHHLLELINPKLESML